MSQACVEQSSSQPSLRRKLAHRYAGEPLRYHCCASARESEHSQRCATDQHPSVIDDARARISAEHQTDRHRRGGHSTWSSRARISSTVRTVAGRPHSLSLMHDLVIRNGRIIDGSGNPGFNGDIAIDGEQIVAVGTDIGAGTREIDADDRVVTPGFVDTHTHYDAQATWDPDLTPSGWHGVTSAVMGNCGVGFAPASPDRRDTLIQLMEGVEDIPGAGLSISAPRSPTVR